MNKKIDNPAAKGPLTAKEAAPDATSRDRGGRMRRPAVLGLGGAKTGDAAEASNSEKNLEALGHLLKTKREINGLTRRDVVVKIKIPLDQLEAIEEGRLSSLPPVFAKGFLRAYANELGLDAESILDDYRKMTGGFKNEPASREPLAPRYVETSVGSSGWRPGPRFLVLAALIIAAAAAAYIYMPELRSTVGGFMPGESGETGETADGPLGEPTAPDEVRPSFTAGEVDNTISGRLGQPPVDGGPGGGVTAAPPQALPVLSTPTSLTLTSTRDQAWAEVVVDGGAPQFFWFGRAGESAKVIAAESIVVTSGTAKDLLVLWDGQDELGPLSQTTANTVRVRFPKY